MPRTITNDSTRTPSHVVAVYDYTPGESEIGDLGNEWTVPPHVSMHLSFLKGDVFKVIGDVDWWLYVTTSSGKIGYIPSMLMVPVKAECLNPEILRILSHRGDVPSYAIDTTVDLDYFRDIPLDKTTGHYQRKICPEENANIFSILTFWWMTGLIWTGYRRPLVSQDLWSLNKSMSSEEVVSKFDKAWEHEKVKCTIKLDKQSVKKSSSKSNGTASDELQGLGDEDVKFSADTMEKVTHPSLLKVLFKAFILYLLPASFLKLIFDVLLFVQPQILGAIVNYIEAKGEKPLWEGLLYAFAMFLVANIQTIVLQVYFTRVMVTGLRIRSAVYGAVYRKALVLSTSSRNQSTVGEMVNLMSVDAQHLMDILTYLNMIWSAPLQIILAVIFLYRTMGVSVFAGVAVMVVLFPINFFTGRRLRHFQVKQMNIKDSRIKLMNEILNGIKVLKLFAWENSFITKILGTRKLEVRELRLASYLNAAFSFLWSSVPFFVSLATFGTYVLLGNNLTASKAFVALALFDIIRFPLSILATLLASLIQAMVSINRLQKFLNTEELDPDCVQRSIVTEDSVALRITNGTFSWEHDGKPTLEHIDLTVGEGVLVAIVGQVGCGKSSLLSALLGEIQKVEGTVHREGSVAYVPQQAWIQNTTMRENVLFGKPYDPKDYQNAITNCCLVPDLEILPGGDMTEIGEKGINLSGGQKQRVSVARAVYSNADIYLLDDPLSAVDSHVGKDIFDKIIGPNGMLKNKTRVLVTHQVRFLPQVDNIIVLKDGSISETGSYSELIANDKDFADFLRTFANEHADDSIPIPGSVSYLTESPESRLSRSSSIDTSVSRTSQEDLALTKAEKVAEEENKMIEQERAETGRVKLGVFLYYFASCGTFFSFVSLFFYFASEASLTGSRIWLAYWSSNNITENAEQNHYVGIYAAFGVGHGFFLFLGGCTLTYVAIRGSVILHENVLNNVLRLPMSFFETTPLGRIMNRFSKDIDVIDKSLPQAVASFLRTFVAILGTIFLICFSTPIFLAVLFPLAALYIFIQRLYVATSRQLKRLESVSRSPIFSHFFETINGVSTIRAFGVQRQFIEFNDANVDENQMAAYPTTMANRWLAMRLELIGNCIIFFAALFGVLARDNVESGLVGLSITVALKITQALNWMVRQTSELETHIVCVERIKEYTEVTHEASWITSKRPPDNWPEKGEIEVKDYGVRYREGLVLALKDINCCIHKNDKIGIVGRTGSGKSTFTMAIFRVIEAATGSIIIDGINIADIGLQDLRSRITIIPQDPILFSASLRFNLDPIGKYTDDQLWSALEVAHLKSFVAGLPGTLDYLLAEGGENLSVGQRQLVCLGRALLRRTKVLILDEATAAVDLETDKLIQQTIRKEFANCTVIAIAHRLNTIMDYTRIIVLSEGQIIEFDTPKALLEKKGVFYGMAKQSNLVS